MSDDGFIICHTENKRFLLNSGGMPFWTIYVDRATRFKEIADASEFIEKNLGLGSYDIKVSKDIVK